MILIHIWHYFTLISVINHLTLYLSTQAPNRMLRFHNRTIEISQNCQHQVYLYVQFSNAIYPQIFYFFITLNNYLFEMSELSDSSQNYQQIITNLFNFKKEWAQVPEVVYLTAKALHSHAEEIQQNIYSQRQVIAQQSIKIKQLFIQLANLKVKNQSGWLDYQSAHNKQSGFKKKRNINENSFQSKNDFAFKSKKKGKADDSPGTKRRDMSINMDQGLNETMIEEVRALIQATLSHRNNRSAQNQLQKLRKEIQNKDKKIEIELKQKVESQMNIYTNSIENIEKKIAENEQKINQKLQLERINMMRYAEESAIQMQKMLIQMNSIQIRLCQLTEQKQKKYSNPKYLKQQQPINQNERTTKNGMINQGYINHNNVEKNQVHDRLSQVLANLSKQLIDFKLKTIKQMTFFMKTQAVQQILNKFHEEIADKLSKNNKALMKLTKEVESIRKEHKKSESKYPLSTLEQAVDEQEMKSKKQKNSQKSLVMIQQSLSRVENHFKQKLKSTKNDILLHIQKKISDECNQLHRNIREELQMREKTLCEIVENNCSKLSKIQDKSFSFNDASTRKAIDKLSEQMIMTRYLHLGERPCRDVIEWDKNVVNLMEENFMWKLNSHAIIIMAAGLYRVEAALFPDNDADIIQAYVVLNGVPISSMKNKQVPVNCMAPSRGSIFNQAILIPAKSKIWLKTQSPFYGQAYLQILKL